MIKRFIKNEIVLFVSFVLAVVSAFFVKPSAEYISYIDFRTLSILLSLMLIMAGMQKLRIFRQLGEKLVNRARSSRELMAILVLLCFFSGMVITNDVALITFVPFSIIVLMMSNQHDKMIFTIVMETIAANLGSMATPIGNPQNLYLFSKAEMSFVEFILLMLPYTMVSLVLLLVLIFALYKKEEVTIASEETYHRTKREKARILMYILLFAVALLVVLRIVNFWVGFIFTVLAVVIFDRNILIKVDYSLIFTFIFLFIFIGNMKQIEALSVFVGNVVRDNEVIVSILFSQVISNVPTAILLSGFTDNITGLIIGTNLGGLGTLIASMASLISFKQYSYEEKADKKRYIKVFTFYNVLFLVILYAETMILRGF